MTDLIDYELYVDKKTSEQSKDFDAMMESFANLKIAGDRHGVLIPQLFTAAVGLPAEAGEFAEIVKKMQYQGKPLNPENIIHLRKELGDLLFYAMMACTALGVTADEVIKMNRDKLDGRYKDGFTVDESENRLESDI